MIELTQDQLEQVEKLASIYMKISSIALIIGVDAHELRADISNESSEVSIRYRRGKATSEAELLAQEMQLAKVGSPLALEKVRANKLDMEDDE